jgi:hypothetical protein
VAGPLRKICSKGGGDVTATEFGVSRGLQCGS